VGIDALIAENGLRRRDELFATQDRYLALPNPLHNNSEVAITPSLFAPSDFLYDACGSWWGGACLHHTAEDQPPLYTYYPELEAQRESYIGVMTNFTFIVFAVGHLRSVVINCSAAPLAAVAMTSASGKRTPRC